MKVYIVAKETGEVYNETVRKLTGFGIKQVNDIVDCDVVITIGGDGTILSIGTQAAVFKKPLLGINTGRLGFMATLEKNEPDKLERLIGGDYSVSRRMLLDVQLSGKTYHALNDVVLHRGAETALPEFAICRNGRGIIRVRGDGIIISTATGSTAYSLSAGGPIIEPELECFLVTALSPHSLFNRPMIFSPDSQLSVYAKNVAVSVDGQDLTPPAGKIVTDEYIITKSEHYLDLIDIDGNNFYDSIHNKLMKPLK